MLIQIYDPHKKRKERKIVGFRRFQACFMGGRRKHAPEAIKTLAEIAKKGTPSARVTAAIALLDRA